MNKHEIRLLRMPSALRDRRMKFESDPYSDEVQAAYDICREAHLHTWNRDDPLGGGRLVVHERYRRQIIQVSRELTCYLCTTMRFAVYMYKAQGIYERYARIGNYEYDWPGGYKEVVAEGHERMTSLDHRAAAFDRLEVVDLGEAA